MPTGTLSGKTLRDATLTFDGTTIDGALNGQVAGSAFLDGVRVDLASAIAVADGGQRLSGLRFEAGGAKIEGDLDRAANGLLAGDLALAAPDISTAAALLLREATGAAKATIKLANVDGKQTATLGADVTALVVDTIRIGKATINADIADLFGVPVVDGKLTGSGIVAGGVSVATLEATARREGETTDFDARARLDNRTDISANGALSPIEGGYRIALAKADIRQGALAARLIQPATIERAAKRSASATLRPRSAAVA